MTTKTFSLDQAIRAGWEKMKKNFWFFAGLILAVWAVSIIFSMLEEWSGNIAPLYIILIILNVIVSVLMSIGFLKISIAINDDKSAKIQDLFVHYRYFLKFLAAGILKGLLLLVGFILLIIPGVYLSLRFRFVEFLIVDKDMGIIEAFKESAKMTDGVKWSIFGLEFCLTIITFLGFLALLVGLFAAVPTVMVARAYMYRKLELSSKK